MDFISLATLPSNAKRDEMLGSILTLLNLANKDILGSLLTMTLPFSHRTPLPLCYSHYFVGSLFIKVITKKMSNSKSWTPVSSTILLFRRRWPIAYSLASLLLMMMSSSPYSFSLTLTLVLSLHPHYYYFLKFYFY